VKDGVQNKSMPHNKELVESLHRMWEEVSIGGPCTLIANMPIWMREVIGVKGGSTRF